MPPSTSDDGGGGDAYDDVQTVATTKAQARKWILEHDTKVAVPPPQLGHIYRISAPIQYHS